MPPKTTNAPYLGFAQGNHPTSLVPLEPRFMLHICAFFTLLVTPVFMGAKSCVKSQQFFCFFWSGFFAFETVAARPLWGEELFVHGTGRMWRRDPSFFVEQRQETSTHPLHHTPKPARATHKSTGNKLVVPHPVLRLQSEQRNASIMPSLA